jgi:hypothetical protein
LENQAVTNAVITPRIEKNKYSGEKRVHIRFVITAVRIPANEPHVIDTRIVPIVSRYKGIP